MSAAQTQLPLDLPPMEAEAVDELPVGAGWQYESKYDGFRCLAHRRGRRVHLQSKNQKPLERYFPEVAQGIEKIAGDDFVLDGELVIGNGSFESLQLRLHPAESRIRKLAPGTPAELIVFDLLARSGISLFDRPLAERRRELEPLVGGQGVHRTRTRRQEPLVGKERKPVSLEPVLVVEVSADHISGEHMRHGAHLLRWRTDKPAQSCTVDQIR
jgi:ATP-dependent DNA ligase